MALRDFFDLHLNERQIAKMREIADDERRRWREAKEPTARRPDDRTAGSPDAVSA